jgi:hypothetical protein
MQGLRLMKVNQLQLLISARFEERAGNPWLRSVLKPPSLVTP